MNPNSGAAGQGALHRHTTTTAAVHFRYSKAAMIRSCTQSLQLHCWLEDRTAAMNGQHSLSSCVELTPHPYNQKRSGQTAAHQRRERAAQQGTVSGAVQ